MLRQAIIFLLLLISTVLSSQREDAIWLFGSATSDQVDPERLKDTTWGATNIDFNFDPPKIHYDSTRVWDFQGTNASICDEDGNLLCYSNGQTVQNGTHGTIEDTINYNLQWLNWSTLVEGVLVNLGLPIIQGALVLPIPDKEKEYYLFYKEYDLEKEFMTRLHYSIIDMNADSGFGALLERDIPLVIDSIGGGRLTACRHANGRDWWIVFPSYDQDELFTFLITPQGIEDYGRQDLLTNHIGGYGQAYFSPDGEYFAMNYGYYLGEPGVVTIYKFDRCTGLLSEGIEDRTYPSFFIGNGLSFSHDSRMLYITNDTMMYQYDLEEDSILQSRQVVARYDGYRYYYNEGGSGYRTTLGFMGLAPDGRIYVAAGSGGNRKMSVVNYPNEKGEDCEVVQHGIHLPTSYARTMPNFPNFRLGPLDGSSCDTLGLDNHPIAKYRYEQDSLDHLQVRFTDLSYFRPESWHWDFGDENDSDERHPYHQYQKNGVYEVCLTVSNENSEHTTCRTLTIGTVSDTDVEQITLSLYPNPVVDDMLVTLGDYIPEYGNIVLKDLQGRKVHQSRIYHGWNSISLSHLISGIYIWELRDGNKVLRSGKVVKN